MCYSYLWPNWSKRGHIQMDLDGYMLHVGAWLQGTALSFWICISDDTICTEICRNFPATKRPGNSLDSPVYAEMLIKPLEAYNAYLY